MTMLSKNCSVFQRVSDNYPIGEINIFEIATTTVFKGIVFKYRETLNKELKKRMPAYIPSGVFSKRNAKSLVEPSNVISIDIDGKDNPSISSTAEMKRLVSQLPFIWYCGDSVGGKGVFCLIKYEDHTKHKDYFKALQQDFMEIGLVIDKGCNDICRLRIVSFDPEPYINEEATVYNKVQTAQQPFRNNETNKSEKLMKHYNPIEYLLKPIDWDKVNLSPGNTGMGHFYQEVLRKIIALKFDITQLYDDWFKLGCIIKQMKGEQGRSWFHEISQFYPDYSAEECDAKYDSIMKGNYLFKFSNIDEIVAKYGLDINKLTGRN